MKKNSFLFSLCLMALPLLSTAQKAKKAEKSTEAPVEQRAEEEAPDPMMRAALDMQRMHHPMHDKVIEWAGHWSQEMRVWAHEGEEPTVVRLNSDSHPVCEGKYIIGEVMGQMGTLPYEAHFSIGYDVLKEVFVKTWFDNMSSAIMYLEGTYNQKDDQITFTGTVIDPVTRSPRQIKQVLNIKDPMSHVLEIYTINEDGKEIKSMEIRSRRM